MKFLRRLKKTLWKWAVELLHRIGLDALATCIESLNRAVANLESEKALHMSQRQWNQELERDVAAREKTIESLKAQLHDPLAEAQKLLRLIDDLLIPVWSNSGREINNYELKSWRDDYTQYMISVKGPIRWRTD